MGAKTSTANGANGSTSSTGPHHNVQQHNSQSPRTRTFSSGSSSATEVIGSNAGNTATSFNLLRAIPGMHVTAVNQSTIDRQRARSLSSVPDMQNNGNGAAQSNYLNGTRFCILLILLKLITIVFFSQLFHKYKIQASKRLYNKQL